MPYRGLDDEQSDQLDACVEKVMAQGHEKSSAIAICRSSMDMSDNNFRFVEPFDYKAGQPFRVMPLGEFKRGNRTLTITKDDLAQMAANYDNGKPRWKIPLYFGHPTDANPDPPKGGNVKRLVLKDDGLYAEPEYTPEGEKSVADGAYQFVSPGVLWAKNGSAYTDEQGKSFDNVIDHVALTNKPFFGKHTQLFSSAAELMQMDMGRHKHMLSIVLGLVQKLKQAILDEETAEATEETAEREAENVAAPTTGKGETEPVETPQAGSSSANYAAGNLPPLVDCPECGHKMPKGAKCPECGYQDKEKMTARSDYLDNFKDYDAETRREFAKKGWAMPNGSYPIADAGDLTDAIHAVGRGGGSHAQVKNHIVKRAKSLGKTDLIPADWEGSTKEEKMDADAVSRAFGQGTQWGSEDLIKALRTLNSLNESWRNDPTYGESVSAAYQSLKKLVGDVVESMSAHGNPAGKRKENIMAENVETFAVSAEEFAALKAKADKVDALETQAATLKTQADTFGAELMAERDARRLDQITDAVETFRALPLEIKDTAEKLMALEKLDGALARWVTEKFTAFDRVLGQSKIFEQLATGRQVAPQADTFDAEIEKQLATKFGGDKARYQDAMSAAAKERPDLFAAYFNKAG